MNRLFQYLARVRLDLSFSRWRVEGNRFRVTTPPSSVVRGFSLMFWMPLLFLGIVMPRLLQASIYWVFPMGGVALILFCVGWLFFWTGFERVFDKEGRQVQSVVVIPPFRRHVVYPFEGDLGSLRLTSRYATEGRPGSVMYSVTSDAITSCDWVVYNNYARAVQFAEELSDWLEVNLANDVSKDHRA